MKYSSSQARKLAQQLRDRFGAKIAKATEGTPVPPKFIAGLIAVEAGKDRNGQIKESATRFESHVYEKLKQVRDGKLLQYNKIRRAQLADASDDALKALATSCGLTQIMQWWSIHMGISVAELRGPNHLKHAVKLLEMTAGNQLRTLDYEGTLRIWNTGRPGGKTHDPDYVANAGAVMDAYAELEPIQTKASPDKVEPFKPEPEKPETEKTEDDTVTNVPGPPQRIEVQPRSTSITTKIAAGASAVAPVIAATGLKIGGVEFKTGGLIAIAAVIIVGMVLGAWLWDRSQERRSAELRAGMANLANPDRLNVVAGDGKT